MNKEEYESGNANVLSFSEKIRLYPCAYLRYTRYPYYLEDGQIKQLNPLDVVRKFKVKYNCDDAIILEADIPDVEMYSTRDELLAYNSYTIIKDDGTEEKSDAYMQKLLFNDKQKKIFERFCNVAKEAVDAGIQFMFDKDNVAFFAINDEEKRISEWFAGCEKGYDTDLYVPKQQYLQFFDIYDYYGSDYGINLDKLNGNE